MSEKHPIIKIYKGFASTQSVQVFGHVFDKVSLAREKVTRNPFKNAWEMYKRYQVKPLKNAKLIIEIEGEQSVITSDKRGYFSYSIQPNADQKNVSGLVFLQNERDIKEYFNIDISAPERIIISDIDDTILVSHATNIWKKLYLLLTKNHETRKAFKGIKSFYERLSNESSSHQFFYVSSSEWNLYDFLVDFVSFNELPGGTFLLQDIKSGIKDLFKSGGGSHQHKKDKIFNLLENYPDAKFVLVGDSGQKDPSIYRDVAIDHPDRIEMIYIRDVRKSRKPEVEEIISELESHQISMQLF